MTSYHDDRGDSEESDIRDLESGIREAFHHAERSLHGGSIVLRFLRITQSRYHSRSAAKSLESVWIHRGELESKLLSYARLDSVNPRVMGLVEQANEHHSTVFSIDRERTCSTLQASGWVGEWGYHVLCHVNELIYLKESFGDACKELEQHVPVGGFDNLEQTIDHLRLSIERDQKLALSLVGVATVENKPMPLISDGVSGTEDNSLDRVNAVLIWGGTRYEWLTENMMDALELLVKRFPDKVRPAEMAHKLGGRLPEGGFKKIFKVFRGGKPGMHPVAEIIRGRAPLGWYLSK